MLHRDIARQIFIASNSRKITGSMNTIAVPARWIMMHFIRLMTQPKACFRNKSNSCVPSLNVTWNIHQGAINATDQTIRWTLFISRDRKPDILDLNTRNLTITKDLFSENEQIIYWRFKVIYSFEWFTHRNTFDIELNEPPMNGSFCSIDPANGTMVTLFKVRIGLIYRCNPNLSKTMTLTHSAESTIYRRLPTNGNLIVEIRDTFGCILLSNTPCRKLVLRKNILLTNQFTCDLFNHD
ncbi:unnamed protein product [Adineta ricciae]|uniref:Uncharacterized protein n=1 Tax=Adineta ricciae TaxID=249248 RepID=A0A815WPI0_ADIRI|nr:unnamed protein product [Adineta ricciae]